MIKRVLAICAVLVLVIAMFGGCGKKDDASTDTNGVNTADINFVDGDGEATYVIVRPDDAKMDENAEAIRILKKYKDVYSVSPKNISDSIADEDGFEILVGETNRPQTAIAKETLISSGARANGYSITSIGNKIVIYGMSKSALSAAVDYFIENYLTGSVITGGINYTYSNDEGVNFVKIGGEGNLGLYNIVYPRYNVSYLTMLEIESLVESIGKHTGYTVSTVTDFTVEEYDTNKNQTTVLDTEIVVGNCERDGVRSITDKDEYEIRFEGKKVYLNGGSPKATAMAVAEFSKMFQSGDVDLTEDSSVKGSYDEVEANYSNTDYYKLTWGDDFEGTKIDTTKWAADYTNSTVYGTGIGGKKLNRCTPESTYLKNGNLYICALQDDHNYYGGMLWTPGTMRYLYGYLEISTLHPKGDGFWTALWTNSNTGASGLYYSETDVEECYGQGTEVKGNTFAWPSAYCKDLLGVTSHTDHVTNTHYAKDGRGFWMDFHSYGFEWMEGKVLFTCDGVTYGEQSTLDTPGFKEAYSTPMFIRVSMATGFSGNPLGRITQNPDEWQNTNRYIVDYIHLYQKAGASLNTKPNLEWNTQ